MPYETAKLEFQKFYLYIRSTITCDQNTFNGYKK